MTLTDVRGLESLPTEILGSIADLLDLADFRSIRLASRRLGAISPKSIFANKTVELTSKKQLLEFVQFTQTNWPGCWLQRLNLYGVVQASPPTYHELLEQAFVNLRRNSASGSLRHITLFLEGPVAHGVQESDQTHPDYDTLVHPRFIQDSSQIWTTAAQSFETLFFALGKSALPVQEIDIFGDVPRCSLACDYIGPVLDGVDLSTPLKTVTSLTLNISHGARWVIAEPESRCEPIPTFEDGKKHVDDICRLIRLCARLETLDLRWFKIGGWKTNAAQRGLHRERWMEEQNFLHQVVQLDQISQLKSCQLRGVHTDEPTLLMLLQKMVHLQRLSLHEFHLDTGSFAQAFDYLTSGTPNLGFLRLLYLYEDDNAQRQPQGLIWFDRFGDPARPTVVTHGANDLTRTGVDLRKPIGYALMEVPTTGHAARPLLNYLLRRNLIYGSSY